MFNFRRRSYVDPERQQVATGSVRGLSSKEAIDSRKQMVTAFSTGSFVAPNASMGTPATGVNLLPMLFDVLPEQHDQYAFPLQLMQVYRDIYFFDSVAGATIDLLSQLPFSGWTLQGMHKDKLRPYQETCERLDIQQYMPELTSDYLIYGAHLSTMLFSNKRKLFTDVVPLLPENGTFYDMPIRGQDPIVEYTVPQLSKEWMKKKNNPRVQSTLERMGSLGTSMQGGKFELNPLTTLFVPRKTINGRLAVSFLKRILPIYLVEKNLWKGTMIESTRRIRSIMHLQVGETDVFEPTPGQIDEVAGLFISADADPLGAVVATRNGVQVNEVRQGGDFWNIFNIWGDTVPAKLRALGISESFLSGDSSYNCVAGDTLIPTENGIMRIDEIADRKNGRIQAIDLEVGSRAKPDRAKSWHYNGKAPTIVAKTDTGNDVQGTARHPMLVLKDGVHEWVNLKDLRVGDILCINPKSVVRRRRLKLNLTTPLLSAAAKVVAKPTEMTPDLAFSLGCIVSEGHMEPAGNAVRFSNSNEKFAAAYTTAMSNTFGNVHFTLNQVAAKGDEFAIERDGQTVRATRNKTCMTYVLNSRQVVSYLNQIGVESAARTGAKTQSYTKQVPWSVLQADQESQAAFLGAYLEGDGTIESSGEITFFSFSEQIRKQIQAIINSWGILCKRNSHGVRLNAVDALELWKHIGKYVPTKKLDTKRSFEARRTYGVPFRYFGELLKSRFVRKGQEGSVCRNDDGQEVVVSGSFAMLCGRNIIPYDAIDNGSCDWMLKMLKTVSPSAYTQFKTLLKTRYKYTEVTQVRKGKKVDVYDLSMNSPLRKLVAGQDKYREPSFIVNGLVGRNTMETSLSVFIDNLKAFRTELTNKVFRARLFPLIALTNNHVREGEELPAEIIKAIKDAKKGDKGANPEAILRGIQDTRALEIPELIWTKTLEPKGDQQYMDLLTALQEKGVPVPLRAIAAAGGYNLDEITEGFQDDFDARRKVAEYQSKLDTIKKEFAPKEPSPEEYQGEFGDRQRILKIRRNRRMPIALGSDRQLVGIANRNYGELSEVRQLNKTGTGYRLVVDQKSAQEKANRKISKALKNIEEKRSVTGRKKKRR